MVSPDYRIRTMNRDEMDIAVDWAAKEGWNPGLYDAESFYMADPGAFLLGEIRGEPVATISVVRYGESFGFLGFYIVTPEYRGQGYGIRIWNAGMERLSGRNVGLDGVVAQQDNYRKSGFKLAYNNARYEGGSGGEAVENPGIVPLSQLDFETINQYDKPFFPDDRSSFLKSWIRQPKSVSLGMLQESRLTGYGMIRRCRSGYKIGPLFANTPPMAEALFQALRSSVKAGQPIYLDIPTVNRDALALVRKYNMNSVFETARMYTGPFPDLPVSKIFGVTTFELG